MAELTLISPRQRVLRPLVEAALENELRLLEAGIRRTQQRLGAFEAQYGLPTAEFLRRYENDELQETLDFAEWVGEHRLLERLRDKAATLREIQFAD
jgi:vacuolar-type H+-ATPase subunit D/Vma8